MIAFLERGMRIPTGRVTRDNLIAHRLSPTQCIPNMFRILGSVDALNEKIGVTLTHHDVDWVYNRHKLTGQGYYLKTKVLEVRFISCLPEFSNGMNKDHLIISREWHDGLHCLTKEGTLGGVFRPRFIILTIPFFLTNISFAHSFYSYL